jgi:hypothetical protein
VLQRPVFEACHISETSISALKGLAVGVNSKNIFSSKQSIFLDLRCALLRCDKQKKLQPKKVKLALLNCNIHLQIGYLKISILLHTKYFFPKLSIILETEKGVAEIWQASKNFQVIFLWNIIGWIKKRMFSIKLNLLFSKFYRFSLIFFNCLKLLLNYWDLN